MKYIEWSRNENYYYPMQDTEKVPKIPPGLYDILYMQERGYFLRKKTVVLDELIDLPFPETQSVLQGMEKFWELKHKFNEYNFTWKRGILLFGIPGGGKTSIINLLTKRIIDKKGGVIFTISSDSDLTAYSRFVPAIYREIEPDRPVLTIIEDIDGLCRSGETETKLLNVLDGIEQMDNVVYVATTNYTERLPERILNRPNRFDLRVEVKSPNAECRRIYFEKKLKTWDLDRINLSEWVAKTEGLTMAGLGEIIKSVIVLGNNFDETLERLGNMRATPVSRNYNKESNPGVGFTAFSTSVTNSVTAK